LLTGAFWGFAPVAILLAAGISWAGQSVTQPALRAAFLYNFANFTEWAADAAGPLTICVLEDSAVESALNDLVGGATINGRVSNGPDFVCLGGIVGLFVDEGRMRFAINPDAAQRTGLRLSSRPLQLAKILKDDRHGQ
jgi:hypothetical protein